MFRATTRANARENKKSTVGERADLVTRCGREIRWVRKLRSMGIVILSAATVLRTRPAILALISPSASSRTIVVADRTSRHGRGAREEDEGEECKVAAGGGHAHDSNDRQERAREQPAARGEQ